MSETHNENRLPLWAQKELQRLREDVRRLPETDLTAREVMKQAEGRSTK